MPFLVDNSVVIAWFFPSQATDYTDSVLEIIAEAEKLPISVDYTAITTAENMELAIRYGLSSYDTAYLGLAMRLGLPIAAKDGALHDAAIRAGVGVIA